MMRDSKMKSFLREVIHNMPSDWLKLTTHRLDIYEEKLAKTQFLDQFEAMYAAGNTSKKDLSELPTAFDYIRLGHPLSCLLEWAIANEHNLKSDHVISFSSKSTPILAVLRKNLFEKKKTLILHTGDIADIMDVDIIRRVYGYSFDVQEVKSAAEALAFEGSTIFISDYKNEVKDYSHIDFHVSLYDRLGSIIKISASQDTNYISEIQHVRRRETIAMTPANCLLVLKSMVDDTPVTHYESDLKANKSKVLDAINQVSGTTTKGLAGSSGLSIQYAIMMGLIHDASDHHPGKEIKIVVPPNCYGGTNDQARRVAACLDHVEVVDLPVDGGNDMVEGIDIVLTKIASEDAIPYIITEIPTNPRVEVPDLDKLKEVLSKERKTSSGAIAVDPVFILDQTFCPNVHFLGDGEILSSIRAISYASGSKFPSGGRCTAGYCISNEKALSLMDYIRLHLALCDNEATDLQYEILAEQMPSMIDRIKDAYKNTRSFVNYISEKLPEANINFVSEELAAVGFTPSVFSLDLPTKGNTDEERESYKRALNHKLIKMMITRIPNESKYCVSYGQLKGCYWTIPATSTQGTTKEGDKDYIARVALSPDMDLELHKQVFLEFVEGR